MNTDINKKSDDRYFRLTSFYTSCFLFSKGLELVNSADLDPNYPGLEVVVGSYDDNVYAWHADGTSVAGWPKITGYYVLGSPAIADLDGAEEIAISHMAEALQYKQKNYEPA